MADYRRCLTARATHEPSLATRLGLSVGIAIALAGCSEAQGDVVAKTGVIGRVTKTCDAGRAIYTYKAGYSGGLAVVENAPECASGTSDDDVIAPQSTGEQPAAIAKGE